MTLAGRRAAATLAVALIAGPAFAARPLVTEDAGVLARGECEFEGFASRASASSHAAQLQLSCGIGARTQVQGSAAAWTSDGDRGTLVGASGKTFLRELTDEQAGVTLAYSFIGSKPADGGWRYDTTVLMGVVSVPLRTDLLLHANLGASRSRPDDRTTALWAGALEFLQVAGSRFDLMAECFGTQRDPLWLNAGIRYTLVPDRFTLNASLGAQGGSERAKLATLGFKLNF